MLRDKKTIVDVSCASGLREHHPPAQSHTVRPFPPLPLARVEGAEDAAASTRPGPDCRFPDPVVRSYRDAYSLPLPKRFRGSTHIKPTNPQVGQCLEVKAESQARAISRGTTPTPHCPTPTTWAPVTVLCCCAEGKPLDPIAQTNKMEPASQPRLPPPPLSPSPCPLIYVPCPSP